MPNALSASIEATLVGFEQYSYSGFTTREGTEVAGGVVHKVWVSEDPTSAPQSMKCKPDAWGALKGLGFGEQVKLEVTYRPSRDGKSLEGTLDAFERATPAARPAPAPTNGRVPEPAAR